MGLLTWIEKRLFNGKSAMEQVPPDAFFSELLGEVAFREAAFQTAVNLIANAVSKCEFRTFTGGKETKGPEYYLWNVEPNRNQNSSGFLHQLVSTLYRHNECLVIEANGQLLVADSFQKTPYALYDTLFRGVTVGDFTFDRTFSMSEVLYFRLANDDVNRLLRRMFESWGKLLSYAIKHYQRSRGNRGILDIDSAARGHPKFQDTFDTLMNERFKKFMREAAIDREMVMLDDRFMFRLGEGREAEDRDNKDKTQLKRAYFIAYAIIKFYVFVKTKHGHRIYFFKRNFAPNLPIGLKFPTILMFSSK